MTSFSKPVNAIPNLVKHGLLLRHALNWFRDKCSRPGDEDHNDGSRWTEALETVCRRRRQCFEVMILNVKGSDSSSITTSKSLSEAVDAPCLRPTKNGIVCLSASSEHLPSRLTVLSNAMTCLIFLSFFASPRCSVRRLDSFSSKVNYGASCFSSSASEYFTILPRAFLRRKRPRRQLC